MITLHQFKRGFGIANPSPYCEKLEAFLRFAEIEYQVKFSFNTKSAPNQKFPFIEQDGKPLADSQLIIEALMPQTSIDSWLSEQQLAQSHAFNRMISEHLILTLVYCRWIDDDNWPLSYALFFRGLPPVIKQVAARYFRAKVKRDLYGQGLSRHTKQHIYQIAEKDIHALSVQLADNAFLMGDKISSVDASLFAFLDNAVHAKVNSQLGEIVSRYPNLIAYGQRIGQQYFADMPAHQAKS